MVALGLLGQQHGLDVGQDAALRDGDAAQQLVELLVVADGQLQVARDDARLLVVAGRVARQLQDLGCQVDLLVFMVSERINKNCSLTSQNINGINSTIKGTN